MKKILIKNIGSLITVSSNSELKKGGKMKELPSIKNAWLKIKDNRITTRFKIDNSTLSVKIIFLTPKIDTAPKVGIESKKEILDASYLLKPSALADVIVMPALLTPGISAKI